MNPSGKCLPLGLDSSMKVSGNFISIYPLKKPIFYSVCHGLPSRWPSFEHSSTQWAALTLTLCTQHYVPVAITHGQDHIAAGGKC